MRNLRNSLCRTDRVEIQIIEQTQIRRDRLGGESRRIGEDPDQLTLHGPSARDSRLFDYRSRNRRRSFRCHGFVAVGDCPRSRSRWRRRRSRSTAYISTNHVDEEGPASAQVIGQRRSRIPAGRTKCERFGSRGNRQLRLGQVLDEHLLIGRNEFAHEPAVEKFVPSDLSAVYVHRGQCDIEVLVASGLGRNGEAAHAVGPIDRLGEPGQHTAGSDLDEQVHVLRDSTYRLDPVDR